jgi:hypothetical protein
MSKFFKSFLNNVGQGVTNPKGTLGDFRHASKLFVDSAFRLAPKQKFLYHVVFNIHPEVKSKAPFLSKNTTALNMLVKSVDLPKFKISTDLGYQYNRKKQIHTKLEYDPVSIAFHDDNLGVTTTLWSSYYGYYFADSSHGPSAGSLPNVGSSNLGGLALGGALGTGLNILKGLLGKPASRTGSADPGVPAAYKNLSYAATNVFRYGLDNGSSYPFFSSIQIFQLSRRTYQSYTLINPKIVSWQHDTLDYDSGADTVTNQMSIVYEAVIYGVGPVTPGNPTGFATDFYDTVPSPLSLIGGGTASLFGPGGVIGGIGSVLGDLSNPETFKSPFGVLGTLVKGANVVNNSKKLNKEGLRQEGFGVVTGALGAATGTNLSGVANTVFPKSQGNGQNQATTALAPREAVGTGSLTANDQTLITNTPDALSSLTSLATNAGVVAPGPNAQQQVQDLMAGGRNIKLNSLANKVVQEIKG